MAITRYSGNSGKSGNFRPPVSSATGFFPRPHAEAWLNPGSTSLFQRRRWPESASRRGRQWRRGSVRGGKGAIEDVTTTSKCESSCLTQNPALRVQTVPWPVHEVKQVGCVEKNAHPGPGYPSSRPSTRRLKAGSLYASGQPSPSPVIPRRRRAASNFSKSIPPC